MLSKLTNFKKIDEGDQVQYLDGTRKSEPISRKHNLNFLEPIMFQKHLCFKKHFLKRSEADVIRTYM